MARKKKKKGTTHRRKRRVSGVHPALMATGELILGAGLGAIAATFINQAIKTSFTTAPGYTGGAVCIAGGAAVPLLTKPNNIVNGVSAGLIGMGAVFTFNETFLSLPGISGMPTGLPNAAPGYLNKAVGSYRGYPPNRVGNFSGNSSSVVAGIMSN